MQSSREEPPPAEGTQGPRRRRAMAMSFPTAPPPYDSIGSAGIFPDVLVNELDALSLRTTPPETPLADEISEFRRRLATSNPNMIIPTEEDIFNMSPDLPNDGQFESLMARHRPVDPDRIPGLQYDLEWATGHFAARLRILWREVEEFSLLFARFPDSTRDGQLRPRIKDYLVRVSSHSVAFDLLGSTTTRFQLVARAINEWLLDHVLNENMVKEFDTSAFEEFLQLKTHLIRSELPLASRKIMLNAMVRIITNMLLNPDFSDFCAQKFHWFVRKLWRYIGPLVPDTPDYQVAGRAVLAGVISKAASLSVEMLCTPLEYVHCFPDVGEAFFPREMHNKSLHIRGDPQVLESGNFRVKLVITPITFICRHTEDQSVPRLVSKANVILRTPRTHSAHSVTPNLIEPLRVRR